MPKQEYCYVCDRPTKNHCRKCGLPLCPACAGNDGVCIDCNEMIEEDNDADD
jgi:hypothetical protein